MATESADLTRTQTDQAAVEKAEKTETAQAATDQAAVTAALQAEAVDLQTQINAETALATATTAVTTDQAAIVTAEATLAADETTEALAVATASGTVDADLTQAVADLTPTNTPVTPVTPPVVPLNPRAPFAANGLAIWYTPLPAVPVVPSNSASEVATLDKQPFPYGTVSINARAWAPVFAVVTASSTTNTVTVKDTNSSQTAIEQIAIPVGTVPEVESDHELVVWNQVTGAVDEMWEYASTGATTATAASIAFSNANTGTGVYARTNGDGTMLASGLSALAGAVSISDVLNNNQHTLLIAMPMTSGGFVAPADTADGNTKGGIPEGTRFFWPASVKPNMTGWNPVEVFIFNCGQNYGFLSADTAGDIAVVCWNTLSYDPTGRTDAWATPALLGTLEDYQVLANITAAGLWAQLEVTTSNN